ncbi:MULTISPECIES: hypothetical protein [unclassified Sphingomonas]|jgi:hypothetical protein|nr:MULTISPECIES: hypothetical protein [unclassified Sphingomonas]
MRLVLKSMVFAAGIAGAAALGGCVDDGYGYGGRVAVGYNAAWGDPYWGWYGDYYYPGTGYYVYDRARVRHPWNDVQRGYWENRRTNWRGDSHWRNNWHDFRGPRGGNRRR